jgi:uncharacterized membrane protein YdcZ (DUF606 family)
MSNTKTDKPYVLKFISGCTGAILIFTFAWSKQFFANLDIWYFSLIEGCLLAAFIIECIGWYRYADDPKKDWKQYLMIALAVACCAWAAGWSCGVNGKTQFEQDVQKAKVESLYTDSNHLPSQIPQP